MTAKDIGVVLSYNNDAFRRTPYLAPSGTKLEWKRNGSMGCVNAVVLGYSEEKPWSVFVQNWMPDWSRPISGKANVWIKKASILRVITQ